MLCSADSFRGEACALYRKGEENMKKIVAMLAVLCILLTLCAAAMADEHVHTWGPWTKVEGTNTHSAVCTECGESMTAKCYSATVTFENHRVGVCSYCGAYSEGAFEPIEGTAKALNGKDSSQRGVFLAVGKAQPFASQPEVLYAFIPGFTKDGSMATFKNKCSISVKIDVELPEGFHLVRVTPQAGDDSNQTPETWTECEYTWEDGVLTFETKSPYLHMIVTP